MEQTNKQTPLLASLTTGAPPPCPPMESATLPRSAPPGAAPPQVSLLWPPVLVSSSCFEAVPAQARAPAGSACAAPSRAPAAAPQPSTTPTSPGGLSSSQPAFNNHPVGTATPPPAPSPCARPPATSAKYDSISTPSTSPSRRRTNPRITTQMAEHSVR